jgi:hypothetical protein
MTSIQNESVEILRQDRRGRVRTPLARRQAVLDEFARSGLSGARFAALHGINYQTFAGWRRKAGGVDGRAAAGGADGNSQDTAPGPGVLTWLEAVSGHGQHGLAIELPGGARLQVADAAQAGLAAHLLRALAGPGTGFGPAAAASRERLPC